MKMEIKTLRDLVKYCKEKDKYIERIIRTGDIVVISLGDNNKSKSNKNGWGINY